MDAIFTLLSVLVPVGSLLFIGLGVASLVPATAARVRGLFARGCVGALIGGTAAVLLFTFQPALQLPGPGHLVVAPMFGALGFGVTVLSIVLWRLARNVPVLPPAAVAPSHPRTGTAGQPAPTVLAQHPVLRAVSGLAGAVLAGYGVRALDGSDARGAAAAMVVGLALVFVGATGRLPTWLLGTRFRDRVR